MALGQALPNWLWLRLRVVRRSASGVLAIGEPGMCLLDAEGDGGPALENAHMPEQTSPRLGSCYDPSLSSRHQSNLRLMGRGVEKLQANSRHASLPASVGLWRGLSGGRLKFGRSAFERCALVRYRWMMRGEDLRYFRNCMPIGP
jgi:hypothetical protein